MKLDQLIEPGWGDAADNIHESYLKYKTNKMNILAVINLESNSIAAVSVRTTFGELKESLSIVRTNS